MKYYKWQKINKEAYASKPNKVAEVQNKENETRPLALKATLLKVIHLRAWAELKRYCLQEELDKLWRLANEYDRRERLHDIFYLV